MPPARHFNPRSHNEVVEATRERIRRRRQNIQLLHSHNHIESHYHSRAEADAQGLICTTFSCVLSIFNIDNF